MELKSSEQREIVLDILNNIKDSINNLRIWNKEVDDFNTLLMSSSGLEKIAADCMLIQAIGEGFKQIDKHTNNELLPMYPSIPWRQVKGMRDHIAHGYFEINVDFVADVILNELDPLDKAVDFFTEYLKMTD